MKEVLKFAAGLTFWEAIVHLSLGLSGVLPITWFGLFTLTPTINTIQIIVSVAVSAILIYYAWIKKD